MKKLFNEKTQKRLLIAGGLIGIVVAVFVTFMVVSIGHNVKIALQLPPPTQYNFVQYPATNPAGRDPELVKRGEYLAKAGDCVACHTNTPEKGPAFGGGLAIPTPFGTIYSPNLSPDKETGIGNWTEAQFATAMRDGVSPEGHYYFPAFPYYYFNSLTDDDLKALKAYLDSVPPVRMKNRANEMVPPFNFRIMQLGWRIMFFYHNAHGAFKNDDKQSAAWNRGKYLVDGLGHCAMCHSPSYNVFSENLPMGAPIVKYNLTGAKIQGYLAPNITKSFLGKVPDQEVLDVFLKDNMIGGGKVQGPMLEVNHDSMGLMTQEDLLAITTYLKSVVSQEPPKPKGGPGVGTYEAYCSGCHAMGSAGAPKIGDKAAWDAVLKKYPISQVYLNAIHGIGGMPAKGMCSSCSDEEIKQTVDYMIKGGGSGVTGAGRAMQIPKPLTTEQAKAVYEHQCSSCHTAGLNGAPKLGDDATWQPILAQQGFIDMYLNITTGRKGHPPHAGCTPACSDAEIKAALEYLLDESSKTNNYSLW